jgi:hypothetical protein
MSDDRPEPQYGEYATPEQQAAAMGRPYVSPAQQAATEEAARQAMSQVVIARPTGYANRFLTVLLLALGALALVERIPTYFSYAASFRGTFASTPLASVTVPASLDAAGIPTLIANVVLFAATVLVSILLLRRGRVSFYVPIVGAVLYGIAGLLIVQLYAPSVMTQLVTLAGTTGG